MGIYQFLVNIRPEHALNAVLLTWSGIIIGVSFMDAPRKFKTPSLTRKVALDVGRTLFQLLHQVERVLLIISASLVYILHSKNQQQIMKDPNIKSIITLQGLVSSIVLFQQFWISPILFKRADLIISGKEPKKSKIHVLYPIFESIKVVALIACAFYCY